MPDQGVLTHLYEAIKTHLTGKVQSALLIPEKSAQGRVYPSPTFAEMNEYLLGDADINAAIQFITDVAVAGGFKTAANDDYKTKGKSGLTAKELVDRNCKVFGMHQLVQEWAKDLIGFGNAVIWKKDANASLLARILLPTVTEIKFDSEHGMFLEYVQTGYGKYPADQLIFSAVNRIGTQPTGYGILQALCTSCPVTGEDARPPVADIKNSIMRSMQEQIKSFSGYNELWVLPGLSDAQLEEYMPKIKALNNGRLAFNKADAKVLQLVPERMRGLDFYAETLWNSFYLALGTAYPKLVLGGGGGFTEAAANVAETLGEKRIYSLQYYLKESIENQIFAAWITADGLDPDQAQIELNWRVVEKPKIEILLPILQKTWEGNGMTIEEWRKILIDIGVGFDEQMPEGLKKKPAPQTPTSPSAETPHGGESP